MANQILLNNINVDAESLPFVSKGGEALLNIRADSFGGGSVVLSIGTKNESTVRYFDLPDGTFTANSTKRLAFFPFRSVIKARLTGSTGASNVFVDILQ